MVAGFISGVMTVVHILVSIGLILIVLLQSQQSMNLSGLFGGASQSALGSRPRSVLGKVTIILAITFFVTTIFFSLYRAEEGVLVPTAGERSGPAAVEEPSQEAEEPPEEQQEPAEQPEGPVEQPEGPAEQPEGPAEQPEGPVQQPEEVPAPAEP
ncbi:MAG: preprotein translocase subunit SecG [bacterium]